MLVMVVIIAFSVKAQTTIIAFENVSRSETIKIKIPELFEGEYTLIQSESTYIKVENQKIQSGKEYQAELFFSECGGYTQSAKIKLSKTTKIPDLRAPCTADGQKGRIIPQECKTCGQDSVWVLVQNGANTELSTVSEGPFYGLTLAIGQKSLKQKVALGDLNLTFKTFKDTINRKIEIQSVVSRFVIKDSTCLYTVTVKTAELTADEDLLAIKKRTPVNRSSTKISFVDEKFKGATLAPGERAGRKYAKELSSGFIPATVEFLKNGVRTRINLYKHLTPNDRYYEVTDQDLGIAPTKIEAPTTGRRRR